ncbi:MAG TPA: hypothetical protein VI279_15100, partial [Rhodocyclaceae bacterium]
MQKRLTAPLRALLTRAAAAAAAATLTLGLLLFAAPAQAGFTPPNGDWREEVEEYRVKVLGGWIRVQRDYVFDRWQINARWNPLGFEKDALDGSIKRILRNEAAFEQQGDAWAFGKRALIRKQSITLLPPGSGEGTANGSPAGGLALQSAPGYRWLDRDGNWIDYDLEGKAVAYGDRNDLHVWLEYGQTGSADANRIVKIRDHHGRTVLTYRYSGDQLVEVRETNLDGSAGRSLALTWNGNLLTQVSDVLGNKTGYTYENNKLKTETDPEGRTRTLTYGPTGRIQKVTEPDGGETLYQYDYDKLKRTFYLRADGPATPAGTPVEETWFDADGRLIRRDLNGKTISGLIQDSANKTQTSSDARGQSTVTTLDDYDNPVRIQYPDGAETRASYSPIHGQVTDETDELGIKTHYDYDAVGNLLKKTEAVGLPEQRITDYTRDAYGQVLSETRRGGSVTLPDGSSVSIPDATRSSQWDSRGNLVQQANEVGAVLATRYDGAGRPLTITDPLNHDWTYVWDAKGRLSRLTDPLNHSLNHSYDKAGNRISSQDAEGHSTTYGYDGKNRLTRITNALGQAQTLAYDAQGRLVRRQDETGATLQTLTYDPDGRLAADTDGNNNLTAYTYPDNSSLPSQITYPTFSRKLTWDARNRNSQTQDQLDSSTAYSTTQAYDKRGNLTQITDRNGKPTTLAYDALGRLIQVTDPAGGLTKYAYDPWDNLLAVQDPKGNTTKYAYDLAGRRTKETRPLGGSQTWSYDLAGNLTQTQDPKGNRISYVYDDARRRVGESHLPAGQTSPSRGISYRYNNANALTGYDDSQNGQLASSASYTLDALNRKTAETITINGKSYAFQTAYTPSGQLARLTWPDAYSVQYSYDQNQNYAGLTLPEGSLSTQQQRWNQPTQTLLPGGTRLNRDYDPLMRLTRSQATSGGGAALMDRGLAYDPESNITQKA